MSDVARQRWFQFLGADKDARVRLFCIPYAGGGASIFRPWAEMLPEPVQLCPVQLPGREWRIKEAPATRMGELVAALADAVDPYTDLPCALFGHSLGALVAFELTRKLESKGKAPVHLFVSGHRAPQIPSRDRKLHKVPDSLFLMELRRLQGTPEEVLQNPELMRLIAPVLRADFEMAETYEFKEGPVSLPLSAFGGLSDPLAGRDQVEPWGEQTTAEFKLRMIPGGHFFMNESRELTVRAIASDLMRAV